MIAIFDNLIKWCDMSFSKYGHAFVVAGVCLASACTWVKPAPGAEHVALVKPAHTENCRYLGEASATVKHSLAGLKRKQAKVADELVNLARNEAIKMGGDTIVSAAEPSDGRQQFKVYACQ